MIEDIRGSQPDPVIIVGGDMNAKVGNQQGLSTSGVSEINTHNQTATYTISTDRSQQLSETDARGRQLCELLQGACHA
jgi:hypothetical protein